MLCIRHCSTIICRGQRLWSDPDHRGIGWQASIGVRKTFDEVMHRTFGGAIAKTPGRGSSSDGSTRQYEQSSRAEVKGSKLG